MTIKTRNEEREMSLTKILTLIGVVTAIASAGTSWGIQKASMAHFEKLLEINAEGDRDHHKDANLHMSLADKRLEFVTRSEWLTAQQTVNAMDTRQREIRDAIVRIETEIKNLH